MSTSNAREMDGLLVAEYRPLLRYAQRLTANGPEAVDLVHIAVTRVLSQREEQGETPRDLGAWLRTVLFRAFVDFRRRARRESVVGGTVPEPPAALAEIDAATGVRATLQEARAMISSLPPHFREPYELYTFHQYSYDRIAAKLGLTVKTVGTRINRARKRLRALLKKQENKTGEPLPSGRAGRRGRAGLI